MKLVFLITCFRSRPRYAQRFYQPLKYVVRDSATDLVARMRSKLGWYSDYSLLQCGVTVVGTEDQAQSSVLPIAGA